MFAVMIDPVGEEQTMPVEHLDIAHEASLWVNNLD